MYKTARTKAAQGSTITEGFNNLCHISVALYHTANSCALSDGHVPEERRRTYRRCQRRLEGPQPPEACCREPRTGLLPGPSFLPVAKFWHSACISTAPA